MRERVLYFVFILSSLCAGYAIHRILQWIESGSSTRLVRITLVITTCLYLSVCSVAFVEMHSRFVTRTPDGIKQVILWIHKNLKPGEIVHFDFLNYWEHVLLINSCSLSEIPPNYTYSNVPPLRKQFTPAVDRFAKRTVIPISSGVQPPMGWTPSENLEFLIEEAGQGADQFILARSGDSPWGGAFFGCDGYFECDNKSLPCEPYLNYEVSLKVKGLKDFNDVQVQVHVIGNDKANFGNSKISLKDGWQTLSHAFRVERNTTHLGFMFVKVNNSSPAEFAIKDVVLTPSPPPNVNDHLDLQVTLRAHRHIVEYRPDYVMLAGPMAWENLKGVKIWQGKHLRSSYLRPYLYATEDEGVWEFRSNLLEHTSVRLERIYLNTDVDIYRATYTDNQSNLSS